MELLIFSALVVLVAAAVGAYLMYEHLRLTQPRRERALRSELEALRAAQRLSIAAWQARQDMAEAVRRVADEDE